MSNSTSMSFGPEWMRPKPVSSASKANDTHRNNNGSSPLISQASPNISRGGKIPWSGIAPGTGSTYSQHNSNNNTMSFANAAASSISRSTSTGGRSTIGSSIGSPNVKRSQLFGTANSSKNSFFNTSSRWGDDTKEPTSEQLETDSKEAEYALLENNGGRNYSVDEMLTIWEDMKRNNLIKPSIEQKNDLFHSILPNQPAILDPALQQLQDSQNGDGSATNESVKARDSTHSNQSSISGNITGNTSTLSDRLLSAKPSLSDVQKENGFSQHKSISQSENIMNSPSSSIVLPGVTNSSWSPFGNSATSLASNSESVFKSNGILPKSDLFISGMGFHASTPPPPGISSPVPTLVGPENTNWIYKDPTGVEQGPFNGIRMQEWYASKWLQESLLIRRVDESEFYSLKDYMTKVNNFFEPFLVPLPGPSRSGYFDENQRLQEDLLQRQRETMRRQQLQQYAAIQLQQQNSGWGSMSPITTPMSPMSHWAQPQPMSSIGQGPFEFGGPGGLSSGLSGSQISLNHINNDVWQPRAPGSIPHTPKRVPSVSELNFPQAEVLVSKRSILSELEDSESSIIKSSKELLMTDDELMVSQPSPVVSSAIQPPFKSPVNKVNSVELPVEPVEPVVPESALATEPTLIKKPKAKSGKKSSPVSEQPTPVVSKATPDVCKVEKPVEEVAEILEAVTVKEEPVSALAKSPKAAAPVLAPWAKKEPIKAKAPSIKEIQEMEAAELKTRKAQQQQQQQQLAASIIQASRSSTPSNAPALPSGATWATVGVASATPKKTLAQIQKEEEEAARKRGPSVASTNVKKYADLAASGSSSFRVASSSTVASTTTSTASSVATSGGAWTTVGPGGKKVGSGAATAPTAASVISAAPAVKKVETPARSVSAINTNKISAASEDFLNWCKSSLQDLHSGVNHTELLSMLFSLPASSESKEIIAETIYSSSTTMDGRRFAEEFIKRRKSVDTEISSSTSWSDILQKSQTTPKPVNDGWNVSFKVVGKKKGRKE